MIDRPSINITSPVIQTDQLHDEIELAQRAADGDTDAFESIYNYYYPRLLRFCGNFVNCTSDAEDLAQSAFVKYRKSVGSFQRGTKVGPWLYKIARNSCLDFIKKKRPVAHRALWSDSVTASSLNLELTAPGPSPATELHRKDLYHTLLAELDELSEDHRTVFLLKYSEDLKRSEIATILEIPEATVKSRLYYAIRRVRRNMLPSDGAQ